jgi:hypothetical protein
MRLKSLNESVLEALKGTGALQHGVLRSTRVIFTSRLLGVTIILFLLLISLV